MKNGKPGGVLLPAISIAVEKAPPGKSPAKPGMPMDNGYGPPGELELAAASELIKAVRSGNPGHVVEAYRALKESCDASKNGDNYSQE